mgnify:CR=1 FL=1
MPDHFRSCKICQRHEERYTEGDCWALAYALHKLTGAPIMMVNGYDNWCHAIVQVSSSEYLDIYGTASAEKQVSRWNDYVGEEHVPLELWQTPPLTWAATMDRLEVEFEFPPQASGGDVDNYEELNRKQAYRMARHLMKTYTIPELARC